MKKPAIVYYTDPLCCWSWVFEPEWKKLLGEYSEKISWKYCLGGMIQDWDYYTDPVNAISRPAQMAPLWMEAMHRTGVNICYNIWIEDPPASSYPASIAIKSAELQSTEAGEAYFQAVREAVMLKGLNIAKPEVLLRIAEDISTKSQGLLNIDRFMSDLQGEESRDAFRNDLKQTRYNRICRFPTLTISNAGQQGIILTGYRPFEVLQKALQKIIEN